MWWGWGYVIGHTKQCSYFGGLCRFCRNWDLFINHSYFFSDLLIFWLLKPDYVPGNWVSFSIKIQEMLSALSLLLKFWQKENVKLREWGICDVSKCSLISSVSLAWKAAEIRKSNSGAKWNCETPPWRPITGGVKCLASQLDNVMWWTTCFFVAKEKTGRQGMALDQSAIQKNRCRFLLS